MSRIGKKPILIPEGVKVEIKDKEVIAKGPKGELTQQIPEEILIEIKDKQILVSQKSKTKKSSAFWGLTRAILQNNVKGVAEGFEKKLEIQGIGFRASVDKEKKLKLEVGFSHPVEMEIPVGLDVLVEKNIITISGFDKQKIGEFAAKIRRVRPPEPYKGKGIRYLGEKVRRKEGKKAVAATT